MMLLDRVTVVNSSPIGVDESAVRQWVLRVLEQRGAVGTVGIAFVGLEEMASLNSRYRGGEGPTDVLSFADTEDDDWVDGSEETEGVSCLGDVVIAPEVARENALNEGATLSHELRVLLTHGLLHLLGYDHETDSGEMLSEQQRLLQDLEGELPDDLV